MVAVAGPEPAAAYGPAKVSHAKENSIRGPEAARIGSSAYDPCPFSKIVCWSGFGALLRLMTFWIGGVAAATLPN